MPAAQPGTSFADMVKNAESAVGPCTTAVYASSGGDSRALSYLHPNFLQKRTGHAIGGPNVFFYIDREPSWSDFDDGVTSITTQRIDELSPTVRRIELRHTSAWDERCVVIYELREENGSAAARMHAERFVPRFFIGVTDGCALGGNRHCVNDVSGPVPAGAAQIELPKYWVTDHFTPHLDGSLGVGEYAGVPDGFPARFRKLALLSTQWGRYGGEGASTLGGATIFEVERR